MSCSNAFSVLSVLCAVLLSACGGPTPTVISGTLLGHDGEPMVAAGVRVSRWSTRTLPDEKQSGVVFREVENGHFEVETFETGMLAVRFSGAYHEEHDVAIVIDTAVSVALDVRLGTSGLTQVDREAQVVFRESESIVAQVAATLERAEKRYRAYEAAREESGEGEFAYDWSNDIAALEAELTVEQDPVLRQALYAGVFDVVMWDGDVDPDLVASGLSEVSATSPFWSYDAWSILVAIEYLARPDGNSGSSNSSERILSAIDSADHPNSNDATAAHVLRAINDHPDPGLRAQLLENLVNVAEDAGDRAKALQYYNRLAAEHPDYHRLGYLETVYSPDRSIAAGQKIPDFSLTSLEDSNVFHRRDDLTGSVYLMDFWATWCAPCIAELPNVHEAFDKYEDRGFQILSVAIGDKKEDIADFRRNAQPMPWLHAFHDWEDDAVVPFEVEAIPRAILVGADGVILASDANCRGERLHETLEQVLGGR